MQLPNPYADLNVEYCPLGCDDCCQRYVNKETGHRIVCHCPCGHRITDEKISAPSEGERTSRRRATQDDASTRESTYNGEYRVSS